MSDEYVVLSRETWELVKSRMSTGYARLADQAVRQDIITVSALDPAATVVGWSVVSSMLGVAQVLEHLGQPELAENVNDMADHAASQVTRWGISEISGVVQTTTSRDTASLGEPGTTVQGSPALRLLS